MSHSQRLHGAKVLKAVSSAVRIRLLNLLYEKGPMSYTELMSSLKMNPGRDAGRFAYHLKFLLKADLVEADVETRKYHLSDLGRMVVDVADEIEKKALRPKRLLVRTSRFTLEEFDANRIADSLIKEANVPADLAQRIAKEAEKQLLKSKTKYLTAPLVREVVNAILIEKGLEEHRHKLTRLGLPVHDITSLLAKSKALKSSAFVCETAGKTAIEEYTLLNVFPRDIADAHLSGAIHINRLSDWILKPNEIMQDGRFFLQRGLNLEVIDSSKLTLPPPKNLESALTFLNIFLSYSAREVSDIQSLDYFNVFLAPLIKNREASKVKEALHLFIINLSHLTSVTLGLELMIPDFIAEKPAFGISGQPVGNYGNFREESRLLASLLLEIFAEENANKPLMNPRIVVKLRSGAFADEKARALLLKAHQLSCEKGIPYFANLSEKNNERSVFSSSGFKLNADFKSDWEIDTLRTGNLGLVTINLPRIVYEWEREEKKFFELLKERFEIASRTLEIKYRSLKQYAEGLLPFLTQKINGDEYFRLENSARTINLCGLREAAKAFSEKDSFEDGKTQDFVEKIFQQMTEFSDKMSRRRERRLSIAILPDFEASERLAQLDIERYGVAKVHFMGTREKPFYSTVNKLVLKEGKDHSEAKIEGKLHRLCTGGNLTIIDLEEGDYTPEELMKSTSDFIDYGIGFFAYARSLTYCVNCKRSYFGLLPKCPSCGSIGTLAVFERLKK